MPLNQKKKPKKNKQITDEKHLLPCSKLNVTNCMMNSVPNIFHHSHKQGITFYKEKDLSHNLVWS